MESTLEPVPRRQTELRSGAAPDPGVGPGRCADELTAEIQQAHDELGGCLRELLGLIAEFDARRLWEADGVLAMPPWLVELLGISAATAHTWTRIAAALEELPETAAAFADGDLSFDQVRALVRFVRPETDSRWA